MVYGNAVNGGSEPRLFTTIFLSFVQLLDSDCEPFARLSFLGEDDYDCYE